MPPHKKKTTKYPRQSGRAVNLDPVVYDKLVEMARAADRGIKNQLERTVKDEYRRWKKRKNR